MFKAPSRDVTCTPSPTDAHHWMIDEDGMGLCKYCPSAHKFTKSAIWGFDSEQRYGANFRVGKRREKVQ